MGGGGRFFRRKYNDQKKKEQEAQKVAEQQAIQDKLLTQRAGHMAEMEQLEKVLNDLKSQGNNYANIANQSQEVLRQNNEAVASAIQTRNNVNLSQEGDSQGVIDEKKKNRSRVGTGISKADML